MEKIIAWAALLTIFLIPAAPLILRMWRKRMKNKSQVRIQENENMSQVDKKDSHSKKNIQIEPSSSSSHEFSEKEILVLGTLIRGSTTFGDIQKSTGMHSRELDRMLENLEKNAMLQVQQKKGLLGIRIDLHPTEKGFKAYSSYSSSSY